jgi:hypothetical protein
MLEGNSCVFDENKHKRFEVCDGVPLDLAVTMTMTVTVT